MNRQREARGTFARPDALPRYAPSRTYDARHIKLEIELDERRRHLQASATLSLAPINDGLREFELDLDSQLAVEGVSHPNGRKLVYSHQADRLHVKLARAQPEGREFEVVVRYQGSPKRGLHFVGPDAEFPKKEWQIWSQGQDEHSKSWFPCYDSPHDKATSEVIATVRRPFRVISNGKLLGVTENARRKTRTFHWREDSPHPAYLTSIVVGDYEETREHVDGVEVLYYVHKRDLGSVQRTFGRTPEMLRFFSRVIDYPYPHEKYAQVVVSDFIFGGMENISATTLTDSILLDATAALDTHADGLIAHELAHQWWGDLLTCKEWSHAWLNEGFATYFQALFTEHHRGREEFLWEMHRDAESYFKEDASKYRRPVVERRYSKPIHLFDRHLYEKGALVLHMLRFELGEDLFWKALRHYVRKHQFQNVETNDFKVAIEEATGRHLDAFFDQWVHSPGFPSLDVSWTWDGDAKLVVLRIKQVQAREDGTPVFSLPLEVELGMPRGCERVRLRVDETQHTFHLHCRQRPDYLRVDPEHWILKKMQFERSRSELLAQLEQARDFFGQVDAAHGLRLLVGDGEAVEALSQALQRSKFFAVRTEIAKALADIGGDRARDVLLAALSHRDPRARRGTVGALSSFPDDDTVATRLMKLLRGEKSYFVRAQILTSLAKIRAPKAFELCRQALRVQSYRDVIRAAALRALGELEDPRGFELAVKYARYGRSRWARDAAMRTLARLGRALPQRGPEVQRLLEGFLHDRSFFAQLSAAENLGRLGRSHAVAALRRLELSDVDGRIQRSASEAIDRLASAEKSSESYRSLQSEIQQLQRQNRDLHERLTRVEAELNPAHRGTLARKRNTRSKRKKKR